MRRIYEHHHQSGKKENVQPVHCASISETKQSTSKSKQLAEAPDFESESESPESDRVVLISSW